MSSPSSTPGSVPKALSSRLLTMKFMQRAAASSPNPSSPSPDEPSPKRQKKSADSPSRPKADRLADQRNLQAILAAEEAKRQVALDKQAAEAGDTRWVLSYEDQEKSAQASNGGLRIIQTGYANLDIPSPQQIKPMDDDDFEDRPAMVGRRSFAKFNKALEKEQGTLEESSDSESDSSEDEVPSEPEADDADDPMQEMIRAERREAAQKAKSERHAQKKAERAQMQELSKKRKKKEVKLNTSRTSLTGRQDKPDRACYTCGGPHLKVDCPRAANGAQKRFYQGADDGPSTKARKVK